MLNRYNIYAHDDSAVICVENDKGAWVEVDYVKEFLEIIRASLVQRRLEFCEHELNEKIAELEN